MKVVLVLSGGTATAWNICNAFRKIGGSDVYLIVCDINPPCLVHSSTIADKFIQVPPISSFDYYKKMLEIITENNIDILVPLIDFDIKIFSNDNPDLLNSGIYSTAPDVNVFNMLSDKRKMAKFLKSYNIPTPQIYTPEEAKSEREYFIKPVIGFGSRNAEKVIGSKAKDLNANDFIIQEVCNQPEITADIFYYNNDIQVLCRERVETKAGICTKAKVFYNEEIYLIIKKLSEHLYLPLASCAQFMRSVSNEWVLTDYNLRLGAGSALSAVVGFKLAESSVAVWLGMSQKISLIIPETEHYVVRYYDEVITK